MQIESSKEQDRPLVSFIIAFYELTPQMLRVCIESILALSLSPAEREIIVIDDGSNQSPIESLDDYLDDILYVRQKNRGLSQVRNLGIEISSGKYLQFVDADDFLIRNPYEHCLDLARYQQPDVVMFDFTHTDDAASTAVFNTDDPVSGAHYLAHHNLQATACCYLFRRSILGTLRFTPGVYHEDEEFTPQLLLRAETICSTDAQAYFYRKRPGSITTSQDVRYTLKRLNDCRQVITKLSCLAATLPIVERQALQRRVAQLTMDYIYNIIVQTQSRHYLDRKLESLRKEGLFPLPDRDYTAKYRWFRRLTNNPVGINLLLRVLPHLNRER